VNPKLTEILVELSAFGENSASEKLLYDEKKEYIY
jgi:hypothetical protein